MRLRLSLLLLVLAGCLAGGCSSTNPDKFTAEVQKWVPLGTPLAKARKTMEGHGFDCQLVKKDSKFNPYKVDCLECEKFAVWFHTWNARVFLVDDKVSGYGPCDVE